MTDAADTLELLSDALDDLEDDLEPLFAKSLAQTEEGLDTPQKAKLQVLLAYVIQDLVFIYLKTKGLDPTRHPVSAELQRVKSYFDKIKEAEDPAKRTMVVDRAAATRFIKAAISEARASSSAAAAETPHVDKYANIASSSSTRTGTHTRFDALNEAASRVSKGGQEEAPIEVEDESSSDDDDIEIIDDASTNPTSSSKGKGKESDVPSFPQPPPAVASLLDNKKTEDGGPICWLLRNKLRNYTFQP